MMNNLVCVIWTSLGNC